MALTSIVLLATGVAGAVARPFRLPAWLIPLVCAVGTISLGAISPAAAHHALNPLAEPIAFLLTAVPLAILLDRVGFFSSVADRLVATGRGAGSLWILAAVVTTVLNLDASVVLLTPLYVRIARQTGRNSLTLAFQPVLLACLASSALPVSNLTNLIAASWTSTESTAFITHLALPSLAATVVGWWRYQQVLRPDNRPSTGQNPADPTFATQPAESPPADPRRALRIGGLILVAVLIGFVAGPSLGIHPWMVAFAADLVLVAIVSETPWTEIPWGTALVAGSLGVLAAAAVEHLPINHVISTNSTTRALAGTIAATAITANIINNLPALLVSLPIIGHHPTTAVWAVLIGVNMGPVILPTGSLASGVSPNYIGHLAGQLRRWLRPRPCVGARPALRPASLPSTN